MGIRRESIVASIAAKNSMAEKKREKNEFSC